MRRQRIFVTGVDGFLGSHLAEAFLNDGHQVSGNDNLIGGYLDYAPEGCDFHRVDCNDVGTMKNLTEGFGIVCHCAATTYGGLTVFSPHMASLNIVTASTGVISATAANRLRRFVMCSSMARCGENQAPFTEDMLPRPQDPHGIGTFMSEEILPNPAEVHGMPDVSLHDGMNRIADDIGQHGVGHCMDHLRLEIVSKNTPDTRANELS